MAAIQLPDGSATLVSDCDLDHTASFRWRLHRTHAGAYVICRPGKYDTPLYLHRLILGLADGEIGDHINGDRLDNRRENLRRCTAPENARNARAQLGRSSPFKGVYLCGQTGRWHARIRINGRRLHLGRFLSEVEAAEAYDEAAIVHFGVFARLNLPRRTVL